MFSLKQNTDHFFEAFLLLLFYKQINTTRTFPILGADASV